MEKTKIEKEVLEGFIQLPSGILVPKKSLISNKEFVIEGFTIKDIKKDK